MKFGTLWIYLALDYYTVSCQSTIGNNETVMMYQWKQLEFNYSSELARQQAINSGEFNPKHPLPVDVDVFYPENQDKLVFVTMPRFLGGIPVTLGTVTDELYNENPVIEPFPNWEWHKHPERCLSDRMVSVFRVKFDHCGKLWVIDNGRLIENMTCSAQILAFDPQTSELIHRYEIPDSLMESTSVLANIIVDVRDSECSDIFVYVADCQVPALIVYDVKNSKSWKIIDKTMYAYPNFGTFHLAGQSFDMMDGLLGMALSPYKSGEDRILFFHALDSGTENWVYTSYIRNSSINGVTPAPEIFHTYPNQRHSQAGGMDIDRNGIAYFAQLSDSSISCWNTKTPYEEQNIHELARDPLTMQYPAGVKVVSITEEREELWFLPMRLQKIYTGTLNSSEINYRIFSAGIDDLVQSSKCSNTFQPYN